MHRQACGTNHAADVVSCELALNMDTFKISEEVCVLKSMKNNTKYAVRILQKKK